LAESDGGGGEVGLDGCGGVALSVLSAFAEHPGGVGDEGAAGAFEEGEGLGVAEAFPDAPALGVGVGGVLGGDGLSDGVGEVLGLGEALGGVDAVPLRPLGDEGSALRLGRWYRGGHAV
jgi:hypothetical protein